MVVFANFLCTQTEGVDPKILDGILMTVSSMLPRWNQDRMLEMLKEPYEERLAMAGALIAAELDRLEYLRLNNTEGRV